MEKELFDDWRAETQTRLEKSLLYQCLKEKCKKDAAGKQVISLVDDAVFYAYQRTKLVIRHMGEFTLHDGTHLFRVLNLMERILPEETINKLSIPEIMLLILTAFFHDIGMAPSEQKVRAWKKDWEKDESTEYEEKEYKKFNRFCLSRPDKQAEISQLHSKGEHSKANSILNYLISEYIRLSHAESSKDIIAQDWNGKIKYRDKDLTREFAMLCYSHDQDALSLLEMDTSVACGPNTYICLPFIGVILRLADILDFDAKRTPSVLFSHLGVRNSISIKEWIKHKSINSWNISSSNIMFQAECEHPVVEATIRKFCDLIDRELVSCTSVLGNLDDHMRRPFPEHYLIKLPAKVDRSKIGPKINLYGNPEYFYKDTKFTLNKSQVIDLLMGTKLYGNTEVALRELLQNSIDACLARKELEDDWGNQYIPQIIVEYDKKTNVLKIDDNGIGMDQHIIDNYYSKIGSSYYNSTEFYDLMAQKKLSFTPTSRFGIGILSCFMVADSLEVDTRRLYGPHDSSEPLKVLVEGHESIFWIKSGNRKQPGTSTELLLREKNPWKLMTDENLIKSVCKTIPNPPFPIKITIEEGVHHHSSESFLNKKGELFDSYNSEKYSYIKEVELSMKKEIGISGFIRIFILEKNGTPIKKIDASSKEVTVNGDDEFYTLNTRIKMGSGKIRRSTDSIEVDVNEKIDISSSSFAIIESKSKLSLHGIEIPMELFPPSWKKQKSRLSWPFPAHVILDINGLRDLDLNTARTEITYNEKWIDFAEEISFIVCQKFIELLSKEYVSRLFTIFKETSDDELFLNGLEKAEKLMK